MQQILCTYPVDENTFRCGSVTGTELAARLYLFQTDPGKPQPSMADWTKAYEAEVLKAYHKIPHQLCERVLSSTTVALLCALFEDQQIKDAFRLSDIAIFLEWCKQAWSYFHAHPVERKLSRRYLGEDHVSFLNIENAVYAISRIKMGEQHADKRVKLAIRMTETEAQLFTVKIRYAEHPISERKRAKWLKELEIGQKIGFFKQERLFSRLSLHGNTTHKSYLVAPYLGKSLQARLAENLGPWKRLWVAFNLCVAIHEMHTGDNPFVHHALRPNHILVDELGQVRMINFSQASFEMTSMVGRDPDEFCQLGSWQDVSEASIYASEMDPVQMDIFALKHILKIAHQTDERCLLSDPIFDRLPSILQTMIDTSRPRVNRDKHTALEIAARVGLVIFELDAPDIMGIELQQDIVSFVQQVFWNGSAYQSGCVIEEQEQHLARILQQAGFKPAHQLVDRPVRETVSPDAATSHVFSL